MREVNERKLNLPGTFMSNSSKKGIREKFTEMEIYKQSGSLEELARKLNPIMEIGSILINLAAIRIFK
jgi:hypothetical protein